MATLMALGGCCFKKLQVWVWVLRFHDIKVWCIAYLWFVYGIGIYIVCVKLVSARKLAYVISDEAESYFFATFEDPLSSYIKVAIELWVLLRW